MWDLGGGGRAGASDRDVGGKPGMREWDGWQGYQRGRGWWGGAEVSIRVRIYKKNNTAAQIAMYQPWEEGNGAGKGTGTVVTVHGGG